MKILMVTNTYLPIVGGLERSIQSFTQKFREWGHEVIIAVPKLEGMETNETGIVTIPAIYHTKSNDFPIVFPLFTSLEKLVDSFQPDVIHAHHPFLMGEMALRLAAQYAKPVVFTYHIMFDHYSHYLPIPTSLSKRFLVELAVGFCNLSTRVIAPSESVRDILKLEGVKTVIDVVPTGVDIPVFADGDGERMRSVLGVPQEAFVLGYVGRLAPEKNLEFLAKTVAGFMKKNTQVHFIVAGKGTSEEAIHKIFTDTGVRSRLHPIGVVHEKNLADCYHALDAFVFASKSETQGMVLCEAMAAGIPVIAIDASGVREVVKDQKNGRLLLQENKNEFSSALAWCLQRIGSQEWKALKSGAKETAKIFSNENCARRALEVYEKVIADNFSPLAKGEHEWDRLIRRFNAEWKIMENFGRATGLALKEIIKSSSEDGP